jgi:murein DD-endopeptidase MepM/ murein hydrolase activator NlpD
MQRTWQLPRYVALGVAVACAGALVAVGAGPAGATPAAGEATVRGRQLTRLFLGGQLDSLTGAFGPQMTQLRNPQNLEIFYRQVNDQLGRETELVEESTAAQDSYHVYTRLAMFEKSNGPIEVKWTFDPRGLVAGFFVRSPDRALPSKYLEYETKTSLQLPFEGTWFTMWGGRILRENRHAASRDQRFAYDFVMMGALGTRKAEGTTNDAYACYAQPIRAPGSGTVVGRADSVPDNVPGVMNGAKPLGNYVILDHGNGEFSVLAHLKPGSLAVRVGQQVEAGQLLGLCGNSGNSSEPHLHYHLQNGPMPLRGDGLPAQFLDYVANGVAVPRGEPRQGQQVAPGPAKESAP